MGSWAHARVITQIFKGAAACGQPARPGCSSGRVRVCVLSFPRPRSQSLAYFHSGNRKETRKSTILDFLNSVSKSTIVSNKARQEFLYVILEGHKTRS